MATYVKRTAQRVNSWGDVLRHAADIANEMMASGVTPTLRQPFYCLVSDGTLPNERYK